MPQNMGGGTYKSNLPDNLEIIKEVGYKNVMVDTDGGQTENPHWGLQLKKYAIPAIMGSPKSRYTI